MLTSIKQRLVGVRRRQRRVRSMNGSVTGWFLGAVAALVMALVWRAGLGLPVWSPLLAIVGGGAAGWLVALVMPVSWRQTAAIVDDHYDLKDRSITALEFSDQDHSDELRRLQVDDAKRRLDSIDASAVVP